MLYKYMDNLEQFWNDLSNVCPKPVAEESTTVLGVPVVEEPQNSTNAEELAKALERISALEKMIAESKKEEDGVHIES